MVTGKELFLALFNNLAVFVVLVALYGVLYTRLQKSSPILRQVVFGIFFGLFAIACMHVKIPVAEGVIVDQRNTVAAISGAFGGPGAAVFCGLMAALYRAYLGGAGVLAGIIGIGLSVCAGIGMYYLRDRIDRFHKYLIASLAASAIILPGFMFYQDFETGWALTKQMSLPYGSAVFLGILLLSLLLSRQQHLHAQAEAKKKAEEALHRSENYYRAIFETSATAMFILEEDTTISHVNSNFEKLLGYSKQEVEGKKSWTEFIHTDDVGWMKQYHYLRRREPRAAPLNYEFRFFVRNGELRHGYLSVDIIPSTSRSMASFIDITERKQAEQQLRESEEKYRMLVENLNEVIYALDENGRITYVSPTVESVGGYSPSELLGKQFVDFIHPEDKEGRLEQFHKTLSGIDGPFEYRFVTKDNQVVWIRTTARPLLKEGQVVGAQGVMADITERKRADAERAEQHALIEAIYRNAPLIMTVVDGDRRIQQVNGFATQFAGRPAEEMLGIRSGEALRCLHAMDDPQGCGFGELCSNCVIRNTVTDTLENGTPHLQIEATFDFSMEGETRPLTLLVSTTPIRFRDKNMALVTMMDITRHKESEQEREKLQSQLLQSQKMESVGRLAGGVAHDFNNMLTIINGYAEMMTDVLSPSEPLYDNALQIREAGKRSAVIVRKLLAFARKQTISPEVMNLNDNVASMLKMLQRLIGENIELVWKPGQNLWLVKMDFSQLDQILANLVVNARDAIADIGKITIETKNIELDEQYCDTHTGFVPGQFVMLTVSDTGCGMDKEVFDNLFEPFFTTKETGKGTGLGLPTVYGIVKQNSGFVNVYSEPGQGTTFRIYLPRHGGEAVASGIESPEQYPPGNGETILVLEDEASVLNLAETMLEKLGYKVLTSNSVHEALERIKSHGDAIDLIITDVIMPEMNGRDFTAQVNSLYPDMKTLFMSGYTANVIVRHGILEEGVHYIQKPFSIKDLAIQVRKAIEEESE